MGIAAAPLRDLVQTIFERAGSDAAEARAVADHLIEANLMGHDSHGVIRVAPTSSCCAPANGRRTGMSRSSRTPARSWWSTAARGSAR